MGSGGFFSLQGSIVAELVGSHRIDKAISIIELVESVGFFAGPVTAGLLLDAFGGPEAGPAAYRPAMVSLSPQRLIRCGLSDVRPPAVARRRYVCPGGSDGDQDPILVRPQAVCQGLVGESTHVMICISSAYLFLAVYRCGCARTTCRSMPCPSSP